MISGSWGLLFLEDGQNNFCPDLLVGEYSLILAPSVGFKLVIYRLNLLGWQSGLALTSALRREI